MVLEATTDRLTLERRLVDMEPEQAIAGAVAKDRVSAARLLKNSKTKTHK